MLLAIDIGNSHTVCGVFLDKSLQFQWRLETHRQRTEDELFALIQQQLSFHEVRRQDIEHIIIANVVPELTFSFQRLAEKFFKVKAILVGQDDIPLQLTYKSNIGADLIVNAEEAFEKYKTDLIILDFGTATTLTVVKREGQFIGGQILPGIHTMSNALSQSASLLPKISVERPEENICLDTVGAMQSGLYWGYVGAIEKLVTKTTEELGRECKIVASGGLAKLLTNDFSFEHSIEPHLTLDGLASLFEKFHQQ